MIDIANIADVQNKIAQIQNTTEFKDRIEQLQQLGGLSVLGKYWDTSYHKTGSMINPNAFMFGLVINDWDRSFQSRNTSIRTSDLQIPFQYVEKIPDWKKTANYTDYSEIIGRFEGISVYANSNAQDFQIVLQYLAETRLNTDLRTYWSLERIEGIQKKLESLVFPTYTNGFMPPPKLLLNIGNIFRSMPVIMKDINIETIPPFDIITGLPMLRKITIELRSSYPMWQALSGDKIFMTKVGNSCFAYKEISQDYSQVNVKRTLGGVRNYNG